LLRTFWLVDALALGGRLEETHDLVERTLRSAIDVGLFSEEVDPSSAELLGNFPQGFTQLASIGSAVNLAKAGKHGAEDQSENEAERAGRARRGRGPVGSSGAPHHGRIRCQDLMTCSSEP
jgi:hypothetical protein